MSVPTGARTVELRALRWAHVHLDATPPALLDYGRHDPSHADTLG